MSSASVLDRSARNRRDFDPSRKEDLLELRFFLENSKWKNGCPFSLEDGYTEIPYQCFVKFAKYKLNKLN